MCQTPFSLVHTLQKSWPLIYCILAPNIERWPLDCGGQEMQGGKKQKKRQSSEKKSENNWQASRFMGTALIIMSSLQVSEPAAFWGRCGYQRSRQRETRSPGSRKRGREGGQKWENAIKIWLADPPLKWLSVFSSLLFFSKHRPREQDRLIFFTGPN